MKIYLSGKITGLDEAEARSMFKDAEQMLIAIGHVVVNPMELNHDHDLSWKAFMKVDLEALKLCDAIFMLPNWKESRGARIEFWLAMRRRLIIIK